MKKIYFFLLAIFLLGVIIPAQAQSTNLPHGYYHLKDGIVTINGNETVLDTYIFGKPFEIKWFTNSSYTTLWDGYTPAAELWGYTNVTDDHDTFEGLLKGTGIYSHEFDTILIRGIQNGNGSSLELASEIALTSSRTVAFKAYYQEGYILAYAVGPYDTYAPKQHFNISGASTIISFTFIDVQLKGISQRNSGGIKKYDATLNLTGANTINNFANIANCRDLSEPIAEGGNVLSNYSCGVFNIGGILNMYGNLLITDNSGAGSVVYNHNSDFNMYDTTSISENECSAVVVNYGNFNMHNYAKITKNYSGVFSKYSICNMHDETLISENMLNGVGIGLSTTFNMYDSALIRDNAGYGVKSLGTFNMFNNTKIIGNNSSGVENTSLGIFNMYGSASITNNSTQGSGGGVVNYGELNMYDISSISDNIADVNGGGVLNDHELRGFAGILNLYDSAHISNNTASIDGGGIYNNNGGSVNLGDTSILNENIQITNNTALTGNGGAIWTNDYTKVFADSDVTFSGNTAYGNAELLDSSDPNFALYDEIHATHILTTAISPPLPFKYAYNNWDINYTKDSVITLNDRYLVYKDDSNLIGSYHWLQDAVDACVANDKGYSIFVIEDDNDVTNNNATPVKIENGKEITLASLNQDDIKTITQPNAARHILLDGKLTLENIILTGISATDSINGGIEICSAKAELNMNQGSVIQNCCAEHGGAVYNNEGSFNMGGDALIRNNYATGWGGGVHNIGALIMYEEAMISENFAPDGGGIFNADDPYNFQGGIVNMYGYTRINENFAGRGGGVCTGGSFNMYKYASITGNTGEMGGGVHNGGKFTMNDTTSISENSVIHGSGGGVSHVRGEFTMDYDASISNNEADGNGGGVYIMYRDVIFNMNRNTVISGNSAACGGGVYSICYSTFNMKNYSMIINNTATLNGGGIYNDATSRVSLGSSMPSFPPENVRITNNTAGADGGAIWTGDYNNVFAYQNVFFSQNSAGNGAQLLDNSDPNFTQLDNIHNTHIFTTTISPPNPPYRYAYNNWDINYTHSKKSDFDFTNEYTQINTHSHNSGNFLSIHENTQTTCSIAPNPATNNITITANNDFNTIEILNLLGQTMLSQPNVGSSAKLDVSTLTTGVYFVRVIFTNGTSVQKFVKQ